MRKEKFLNYEGLNAVIDQIKKKFAQLKTIAFSANYSDLIDAPTNATSLTSGFMSSADKSKLDSIEEGAQINIPTNNLTPTFNQSSTRSNINSGESLSVIFGKIKKWFSDLKPVAFTGSYHDLDDQPTIPTKISELTNDSGLFVSDTEKNTWNAKLGANSTIDGGTF